MATDLECPRCGAPILMDSDSERVTCDDCGAQFKRKRRSDKSASGRATPRSSRTRRKREQKPQPENEPAVSRQALLIIGGVAFGFLALVTAGTLVWFVATGGDPGGAAEDIPAGEFKASTDDNINVSDDVVDRVASGNVEWFSDEFVTVDSSDVRSEADSSPSPIASSARAVAADGSETPPAEWLPLPVLPAVDRSALPAIPGRPDAWNDDSYVLITVDAETQRGSSFDNRYSARWQRFDLETCLPTSPRFLIGAIESERNLSRSGIREPIGTLSPDGAFIACQKFGEPGTVIVWDRDGVVLGTLSPGGNVDWLDWNADGRLLTLAGGVLEAWSIPDMVSDWSSADRPVSFVELSRRRDWLAVAVLNRICLIDAGTGERRGELLCDLQAGVRDIAVSDSQQQLAAIYGGSNEESTRRFPLLVWNLQDGTAQQFDVLPADALGSEEVETMAAGPWVRSLQWLNDEQLIVHGWEEGLFCDLYHLRAETLLARFSSFNFSSSHIEENRIFHGPADWLWVAPRYENGCSAPVSFLSEADEDHRPLLELIEWIGTTKDESPSVAAVRVELDAGSEERSREWARYTADALAERGIPIGPGDHVLRGRFGVTDSDSKLYQEDGQSLPIPMLAAGWELIAPDGTTVWTSLGGVYWTSHDTEHEQNRGVQRWDEQTFNFTALNYRRMIVEEILSYPPERIRPSIPFRRLRHGANTPATQPDVDLPLRLQIAGPDGEIALQRFGLERTVEIERIGLVDEFALPDDAPVWALDLRADGTLAALTRDATGLSAAQFDRTAREWMPAGSVEGDVQKLAATGDLQQFAFLTRSALTTFRLDDQVTRRIGDSYRFSGAGRPALSLSPDGAHVAFHLNDYSPVRSKSVEVTVWDTETGTEILKVETELPGVATGFSNDGKWFVVSDTKLRLWDADAFEPVADLDGPFTRPELREHEKLFPRGVCFSPDDGTIAIWGNIHWNNSASDSLLWFYRLSGDGEQVSIAGSPQAFRDRRLIWHVSFDESGRYAAVHLWPLPSMGRRTSEFGVILYDVQKGVAVREWGYSHGEVTGVDISPDGSELAFAAEDRILVFDVRTPLTELNTRAPLPSTSPSSAPDPETVETGSSTSDRPETDTAETTRPERRRSSRRSRGR